MKLISRQIFCKLSENDARACIHSVAYYFSPAVFNQNHFSISCPFHRRIGPLSRIRLKGTIFHEKKCLCIVLELHTAVDFFSGCLLFFLGVIALIWSLFCNPTRWLPVAGLIVFGLAIMSCYYFEGKQCLDNLEKKLIENQQERIALSPPLNDV